MHCNSQEVNEWIHPIEGRDLMWITHAHSGCIQPRSLTKGGLSYLSEVNWREKRYEWGLKWKWNQQSKEKIKTKQNKKMIIEEEGRSFLNCDNIDSRQYITGPLLIQFLKVFYLCQMNSVKLLEDEGGQRRGQKHRFSLQLLSASDFYVALT